MCLRVCVCCATATTLFTRATRTPRDTQVYEPRPEDELAELELEVRLLQRQDGSEPATLVRLDAGDVVRALTARSSGHVLAAGEVIVMQLGTHALRLRVAQTDSLDAAARVRRTPSLTANLCSTCARCALKRAARRCAQEEAIGYHCFRGVLTPATQVYLRAQQDVEGASNVGDGAVSRGGGLELCSCPLRPASVASANRVTVNTNDGECFVVHKSVLRPCITLTAAVREAGPSGGSDVHVDVGCLVFDRVLLFLEAQVRAVAADAARGGHVLTAAWCVAHAPSRPGTRPAGARVFHIAAG